MMAGVINNKLKNFFFKLLTQHLKGLAQKQCYTDKNAKVHNGSLIIQARKENLKGCSYSSSRIRSKYLFKPSVIEIRAKLPKGKII